MPASKLLAILRAHNQVAKLLPSGDIEVEAVYCRDGKAFTEVEVIKPTIAAVRDFLNY